MKKCTNCAIEKPRSDFYLRSDGYYSSWCKECSKAKTKARYRGPQYEKIRRLGNEYSRAKHYRIKDAVFAAYGGYKCACCGETEPKFLTLDHVKNDGAAFRRKIAGNRSAAGGTTYRWLVANGFPAGYQILCMNCNHGKRMNNGVCPHVARCNDQSKDVGPSGPKRGAPVLKIISGTG